MIRIHYAKAVQPHRWAKIAGPFETSTEAWAAVDRLRPLYPDCNVVPHVETVSNAKGPAILGGPKITERTK